MITEVVLLFILIATTEASKINCPTSSWTSYKELTEKYWSVAIPNHTSHTLAYSVQRKTVYQCSYYGAVIFNTTRKVVIQPQEWKSDIYQVQFKADNLGLCEQECDNSNVKIKIYYQRRTVDDQEYSAYEDDQSALDYSPLSSKPILIDDDHDFLSDTNWSEWSNWSPLAEVTFLLKNCNKLHWTSWALSSACNSSILANHSRSCVDCDEDEINEQYCNGNSAKQEQCRPVWSNWVYGKCNATGCNATGERLRKRECLYSDGSKDLHITLCSDQPAVVKEQCFSNATTCTANMKPIHLYVIISSITVSVIIFLCCLIVFIYRKRRFAKPKQNQSSPERIRLNIEHHIYNVIQDNDQQTDLQKIRIEMNSFGETSLTTNNKPSNLLNDDDTNADQKIALNSSKFYNSANQSNPQEEKSVLYSFAEENPTSKRRSTKKTVVDKQSNRVVQAKESKKRYVTMKPIQETHDDNKRAHVVL